MTVKELKEALEDTPDFYDVYIGGEKIFLKAEWTARNMPASVFLVENSCFSKREVNRCKHADDCMFFSED